MDAINRLFLYGIFAVIGGGCTTLSAPPNDPAPVAIAVVSPASGSASPPRVSPLPPARDIASPGSSQHAIPRSSSASPDALFTALAALGIDYRYGGRSPATGFDCSGLVAHVFRDAYGLAIPAQTRAQSRLGKAVDLPQIETGDLVFYNTQGQPNSHVGIYIGDNRFIHAPRTGSAVRIESMHSGYWKTRFTGARRLVF